jgi:predicted hydrocarbon binding protein
MNYSRNDLRLAEATMNQLRNAIYHLARFLLNNGVTDLKERLRQMGRNIAKTYYNYWNPVETVSLTNIREVIATIYKEVLKSSVSVEINDLEQLIIVNDSNCALCKYHYEDIEIAGCEILLGLIPEYINQINMNSNQNSDLMIEPVSVQKSKAMGNKSCVQIFKYNKGEIA